MNKAAKGAGINIHYVDYNGVFLSSKNGKEYINYFPLDDSGQYIAPSKEEDGIVIKYAEPIEIDKENTLFLYRDLPGDRKHWVDMLKTLEYRGYFLLNSLTTNSICTSKYLTDVYLKQAGLKTPKTVRITHSEDSERAFKELKSNFPIILKLSHGTQTGIGVVKIDNMRTLHTTIQMIMMLDKKLPLLIQEFIELKYDIRAMVLNNEVIAVMKRNVIEGNDFRSNVSLGAEAEKMELTELEKKVAIKDSNFVWNNFSISSYDFSFSLKLEDMISSRFTFNNFFLVWKISHLRFFTFSLLFSKSNTFLHLIINRFDN